MLTLYKKNTFLVGKWEVDPLHNTIRQGSEKFDIEPKAMQVLEYLARYAGQTVHRDTLFKAFWPNQIVTEEALTRVISHLRHCFADLPKSPKYIVTVRKTGYRLIANVTSGDYFASHPLDTSPLPVSHPTQEEASTSIKFLNFVTKLATFSVATLLIYLIFNQPTVSDIGTPKVRYITSELGGEMSPTISPNGLNVAYVKNRWVWNEAEKRGNWVSNLLVKNISTNKVEEIEIPPGRITHPQWAPDNIHLAFVNEVDIKENETRFGIYKKNILTGELTWLTSSISHNHGITWSPDGEYIVFPDGHHNDSKHLYRLNIASGEKELILSGDQSQNGSFGYPKYSPNGKYIAFIRTDQGAYDNVDILDTQTNIVKNVLATEADISTLAWKNNDTIFLASGTVGSSKLMELSLDSGKKNYINVEDKTIEYLSYSQKTERLIFESLDRPYNILVSNYAPGSNFPKDFVHYTQSNKQELEAVERPDGLYTAIISTRSGAFDIWLRNNQDNQSQKLTSLNAENISDIDWSPDQNRLAFIATINNKPAIYWYDLKKHRLRSFAHEHKDNSDYSLIGWQNDETLLFSSNLNEQWKLWRYHTKSKDLVLASNKPIMHGRLSPDRQVLYFVLYKEPGIWKSALNEATATQVPGTENVNVFRSWTVSDRGIFYFLYGNIGKRERLYFLDFKTSETFLSAWVWSVKMDRIYWSNNRLYYSVYSGRESDVALLERL